MDIYVILWSDGRKGKSVANKRRKFIIVCCFCYWCYCCILEPEARKAIRMFTLFSLEEDTNNKTKDIMHM